MKRKYKCKAMKKKVCGFFLIGFLFFNTAWVLAQSGITTITGKVVEENGRIAHRLRNGFDSGC